MTNSTVRRGAYAFCDLNIKHKFSYLKQWCQSPEKFQRMYALFKTIIDICNNISDELYREEYL